MWPGYYRPPNCCPPTYPSAYPPPAYPYPPSAYPYPPYPLPYPMYPEYNHDKSVTPAECCADFHLSAEQKKSCENLGYKPYHQACDNLMFERCSMAQDTLCDIYRANAPNSWGRRYYPPNLYLPPPYPCPSPPDFCPPPIGAPYIPWR